MEAKAYIGKLQELLALEEQTAQEEYRREVQQRSMGERKQRGLAWFPVEMAKKEFGFGEQFYLAFDRTNQLGSPHRFQVGDRVAVSAYEQGRAKEALHGVVVAVWTDRMKVAFRADDLPEWMEMADLGIDLLFDEVSFREMRDALKAVADAEGRLKELRNTLLGERPAVFDEQRPVFLPETLNPSQQRSVAQVLQAEDVAIIHGPPGTGKTTTLVQAIKQVLDREKQVLVCAPSNTAVDVLTERLAAKGLNVLRIGNPARVGEDLMQHTLEAKIAGHPDYKLLKKLRRDADEFRSIARKYKRNFGREEREQRKLLLQESKRIKEQSEQLEEYLVKDVLQQAQAITATLVGSASKYLRRRTFSTAFIDEAGQALAPACWIPIVRAERVVLAGDHCQLPPTVKSHEAAKKGLEQSLMEQCLGHAPHWATLLDTQYRMNEAIMGFSSERFYQNELQAAPNVAKHALYEGAETMSFVDTAGCGYEEAREGEHGSYFNEGEAALLLRHLQGEWEAWTAQGLDPLPSIGIISPYRAQVARLQDALKEPAWEALRHLVRIQSVDGFQGQEQDVIYISLVRSNDKGNIGFLQDVRRMNVALTRARKRLVVIGDSATLGSHDFYERFLQYIDAIGAYRTAWEWM